MSDSPLNWEPLEVDSERFLSPRLYPPLCFILLAESQLDEGLRGYNQCKSTSEYIVRYKVLPKLVGTYVSTAQPPLLHVLSRTAARPRNPYNFMSAAVCLKALVKEADGTGLLEQVRPDLDTRVIVQP